MNKIADECEDCRDGRDTFREVIGMIEELATKGTVLEVRADKMKAEFNAQIEKETNCGNPECPNIGWSTRCPKCGSKKHKFHAMNAFMRYQMCFDCKAKMKWNGEEMEPLFMEDA